MLVLLVDIGQKKILKSFELMKRGSKYLVEKEVFTFNVAPEEVETRLCGTNRQAWWWMLLWFRVVSRAIKPDTWYKMKKIWNKSRINWFSSGLKVVGNGFIFQQHNDSKHSFKLCRCYFESKELEHTLKNKIYRPHIPDLNSIEVY